jgi:hypothetical protein
MIKSITVKPSFHSKKRCFAVDLEILAWTPVLKSRAHELSGIGVYILCTCDEVRQRGKELLEKYNQSELNSGSPSQPHSPGSACILVYRLGRFRVVTILWCESRHTTEGPTLPEYSQSLLSQWRNHISTDGEADGLVTLGRSLSHYHQHAGRVISHPSARDPNRK